ncbi:MAG TPA: DUF4230 domain-containing protein [Spirochaetia bacterium]|nr:DUF4230 domain-containing protein [Spirochaetia bacterium]
MKMKKLKRIGIGIVVLAVACGLAALIFRDQFKQIKLPSVVKRTETGISEAILANVRDICAIHTVEYVYKVVFPHDFLPKDMNFRRLLQLKALGRNLSDEDKDAIRVYELCKLIKLDPEKDIYNFFVITARVKAGFDLTDEFFTASDSIRDYISLAEDGTVKITLPPSVITEFVIEDAESSTYLYPDVKVSPAQWKLVTEFVSQKIRDRVIEQGILVKAEENGKTLIEQMLNEAGKRSVLFE